VPGVAGAWAWAAIPTTSDAAPAAVNIDRSMGILLLWLSALGQCEHVATTLSEAQGCMVAGPAALWATFHLSVRRP